jgi:hypothetical protein
MIYILLKNNVAFCLVALYREHRAKSISFSFSSGVLGVKKTCDFTLIIKSNFMRSQIFTPKVGKLKTKATQIPQME